MRRILARLLGRAGGDAPAGAGLPDLGALVEADRTTWEAAVATPERRPVLVATGTGGHAAVAVVEGMLSAALALRGAEPHVLLCDGALPACMECDVVRYPDVARFLATGPQGDRCERCCGEARAMFEGLGVAVHTYSECLSDEDRTWARATAESMPAGDLRGAVIDGASIGEHAYAGALRFFARGDLEGEPQGEAVLRRYVESALLTARATSAIVERIHPEAAVFHHGIYVPQGIVGDVLRQRGVHVVNWAVAYRSGCFIFSHGDSYHRTMMDEPVSSWEDMAWGDEQERDIVEYLRARWYGSRDWILVQHESETDADRISEELGIDLSKPTVGLLTNVTWDAQLFYSSSAFPRMLDWLMETIRYFGGRDDLQLLIRVHPAEVTGTMKTRQPAVAEIRKAFPELPGNVFVIGPESKLSTYAAMEHCDAAIIYGTKTGVELAATGLPVIVAGEAWIRGKGIALEASTAEEYFALLDRLPLGHRLDAATLERARRYAYHFFMRRMIPLDFMRPTGAWPPFELALDKVGELAGGRSLGLDIICDGILEGAPFIYPAETLGAVHDTPRGGEPRT